MLTKVSKNSVLIAGDFNFPNIEWTNEECTKKDDDLSASIFLDGVNDCFFKQSVVEPTFSSNDTDKSILDLVFTETAEQISDVPVRDHVIVHEIL